MASRKEKEHSFLTEVPDKGRSWIIAVACCIINMLFIGASRTSPLLYVAIINSSNISRKEASLPFTLEPALKCLCGPVVGFLADRFEIRLIVLIAGILGAFGIGMCFFTHQIIPITIFWGVLFGIGTGMGTTALPVIINEYFNKYRARAIGISLSGCCLGAFILPPLVELVLREYDLNGTFIILAGVILNCVPLAILLRKPSFVGINGFPKCNSGHVTNKRANRNCSLKNEYINSEIINVEALSTIHREIMSGINSSNSAKNIKTPSSETTALSFLSRQESSCEKTKNRSLNKVNLEKGETSEHNHIFTIAGSTQLHEIEIQKSRNINTSNMIRTNAFKSKTRIVQNSFRKNMSLFKDPMFVLIALSRALFAYNFLLTATILADFAVDVGVEIYKLPYILMSLSVGDLLSRLSLGLLIDKGFMTVMQYTSTFFLLLALFVASLAWATGFWYLVTASFAYGVCAGALILSSPLLIAEFIETKLQAIAMPSFSIIAGLMFFINPKLIEIFREQNGSYVGLFYMMSATSLICAATWIIVPFYMKHRS